MNKIKALRGAATHNGARKSDKSIIPNHIRNAILRGSVFGATLAAIIGCMYTEIDPFIGCMVSGAALGYMGLFYGINHDDVIYGGSE